MFPKMRTGFSTQYERAPPRLVSTCITHVMHEGIRLATKNMAAAGRTYIQPLDLLAAFKQMACNDEFIESVALPDTCDLDSTDLSLTMANSLQIEDEEQQEEQAVDPLQFLQTPQEEQEEEEDEDEEELEPFSWPSDAAQQADDELYQMWSSKYTYRSVEEMEEENPQPIRQALMRTITKMEELIAQLNLA